LRALEIAETQL